jgi:hypothetical protein
MSELWAKVSLSLVNASEPITVANGLIVTTNLTPLNDQANVVQTVNGQSYLLSLSTNISLGQVVVGQPSPQNGSGATEYVSTTVGNMTSPEGEYRLWAPSVTARVVPQTFDVAPLNNIIPKLTNLTNFPNEVNEVAQYGGTPSNEVLQDVKYYLITLGSGAPETAIVPDGAVASSYIPNFYAPVASDTETDNYGITNQGPESETTVVYYPQYIWVDLGQAAPSLFTTGNDTVNFSNLTASQEGWSRLSEQFFRVDKWSVCRG